MNSSLAEDYLHWLGPQIRDEFVAVGETFNYMLEAMFDKQFEWSVPNDDNRLQDGLDLRAEFCFAHSLIPDQVLMHKPCSFLEVLIGLSRRLAFAAGGTPRGWSWQLLANIELTRMTDPLSRYKARKLDEIMNTVIFRSYHPNGVGSFFPLSWPDRDMTQVELWYQMAAYIEEIHPEH